jgi:hypothetical protein
MTSALDFLQSLSPPPSCPKCGGLAKLIRTHDKCSEASPNDSSEMMDRLMPVVTVDGALLLFAILTGKSSYIESGLTARPMHGDTKIVCASACGYVGCADCIKRRSGQPVPTLAYQGLRRVTPETAQPRPLPPRAAR